MPTPVATFGASLIRWHKASAITGLVDGDLIPSWPDSGPLALAAAQATSSRRPVYKTAILNGQPAVRFDGVDDVLFSTVTGTFTTLTMFVVLKYAALESATNVAMSARGSTAVWMSTQGSNILSGFARSDLGGGGAVQLAGSTPTAWSIHTALTDGTNFVQYLNGALINSTARAGAYTFGSFALGANRTTAGALSEYADFDIVEVVLVNGTATAPQRAEYHSYVQDTYGITVSDYVASAGVARSVAGVGSFPTAGAVAVPS